MYTWQTARIVYYSCMQTVNKKYDYIMDNIPKCEW